MDELFQRLSPAEKEAFLNGPALPPPSGVPDFHYRSGGSMACYTTILFSIILVAFMALTRLYAKVFCLKVMRVEDCK
jgi:hypothetical protein